MIESTQLRCGWKALVAGAAVFVAATAAAATADAQPGPPYTYTKLVYPGAIYTDTTGISNAGTVVGTYRDEGNRLHGYSFDGTTYTPIDYPSAVATYTIGIGNNGTILGTYAIQIEGPWHAFSLRNGVFTSFDFPNNETDARGMNASGQIAGVFNAGGITTPHAFVKTGDNYLQLDYPGAWGTEGWGINDAGVVSGNYYDTFGGGIHGFIYANGAYTAVNFPGASLTRLTRLNNLNQAVGWHSQGDKTFGFVLTGSSYRSVSYDDSDSTVAAGINDLGHVVGRFTGPDCPGGCGFIAKPKAGPPPCSQTITMGYAGSTLTLGFGMATQIPTTWATYLYLQNTLVPLWSVPLPALPSGFSLNVPLNNVPHLGYVWGLTLLSTATGGVVCADAGAVNTGF